MTNMFKEAQLSQQRHYDSLPPFPAILNPSIPSPSLSLLIDSIKTQKSSFIEPLLQKHGAILLRGFPISTASEFNDFVEAFGYEDFPYRGAAPRTRIVGNVYTANEGPPDQDIKFHHEMNRYPTFPSKLFFFCEVAPESGGETPIVLSHIVYEKMKERHPDFVQALEEHGLVYTRDLPEDDDPTSAQGRGWKSTFSAQDKSEAEERAAKMNLKLEWFEGGVRTITEPVPAIRVDETRNRKVWFNNLTDVIATSKFLKITMGDGKPLPLDILLDLRKILNEECVAIPWQKGDILLVDNWAAQHSRRTWSFHTQRRVLAALCA
ncbi:hypothetical protein Tsubulata_006073 [Turnera subulata]|uniref:TauD/TfdA-like domain-containing protein n=1 Tax=Turnera subulata TaxID=218843 RepID=A0A9Q0FGL2_9ROSI|nr:hypothetical protein Tsubulata_006073 [Turnera subulata]